jgi:hypothetical protein
MIYALKETSFSSARNLLFDQKALRISRAFMQLHRQYTELQNFVSPLILEPSWLGTVARSPKIDSMPQKQFIGDFMCLASKSTLHFHSVRWGGSLMTIWPQKKAAPLCSTKSASTRLHWPSHSDSTTRTSTHAQTLPRDAKQAVSAVRCPALVWAGVMREPRVIRMRRQHCSSARSKVGLLACRTNRSTGTQQ